MWARIVSEYPSAGVGTLEAGSPPREDIGESLLPNSASLLGAGPGYIRDPPSPPLRAGMGGGMSGGMSGLREGGLLGGTYRTPPHTGTQQRVVGGRGGASGGGVLSLHERVKGAIPALALHPRDAPIATVVVGPKPLIVRAAAATDSLRLGQLQPGRRLTVLRLEKLDTEGGDVRACVALDDEIADAAAVESWREVRSASHLHLGHHPHLYL